MNSRYELLERVKAASGPQQRALLVATAEACLKPYDAIWPHWFGLIDAGAWESAALAMVERVFPDGEWGVGRDEGGPIANLWALGAGIEDISHRANTPALALLAALLSALLAQASAEGTHDGSSPKPQDLSARDQ